MWDHSKEVGYSLFLEPTASLGQKSLRNFQTIKSNIFVPNRLTNASLPVPLLHEATEEGPGEAWRWMYLISSLIPFLFISFTFPFDFNLFK